jgi:hypothetical protein
MGEVSGMRGLQSRTPVSFGEDFIGKRALEMHVGSRDVRTSSDDERSMSTSVGYETDFCRLSERIFDP